MVRIQTAFLKYSVLPLKQQQQPHRSNTNTAPTTPSQLALSIPEILEHILTFLNLKDRQTAAQFVCKQWHSICTSLTLVPFIWPLCLPDDENQTALGRVQLAQNLTIRVFQSKHATERLESWAATMRMLSEVILERRQPKLRILHITEGVIANLGAQLPQLPLLPYLTTLKIDRESGWDILYLFTIFNKCPNLEELVIKPTWITRYTGDTLTPIMDQIEEDILVNKVQAPMTRLRTCILYNMLVTIPALKVFLETCPRLSELILISMFQFSRANYRHVQITNRQPIIDLIATHCPILKKFHLSVPDNELREREITSILEHFPDLDEYSFSDRDADPILLVGLRTVVNRVTTLNLLTTQKGHSPRHPTLRDILCTFTHLIHLRAPNMTYHHGDMDVNDIHGQTDARWNPSSIRIRHAMAVVPNGQYIWACRGLRTLHMSVGGSIDWHCSQIMFGFLSRQCPRLQELYLRRGLLNLSFNGGLCLLTRLQELERIRIITRSDHGLDDQALFWLRTTPSMMEHINYPLLQLKVQRDIRKWAHRLPGLEISVSSQWARIIADGQSVGVDLSNVGLREDLLEWMTERYGPRKMPTWPSLKYFSIETEEQANMSGTRLQNLKAFVAKVRPNPTIHLLHPARDPFFTTLQQH